MAFGGGIRVLWTLFLVFYSVCLSRWPTTFESTTLLQIFIGAADTQLALLQYQGF